MKITIQTNGTEFTLDSQTGVYLETRSFAFFWPRGERPIFDRKPAQSQPEALPEAA